MVKIYHRDKIILNQRFLNWFDQQDIYLKVKLVARDIQVDGDVELLGHGLFILADRFDGSNGQIRGLNINITVICRELVGINASSKAKNGTSGARGRNGERGRPGRPGKSDFPDGGDGGPGGWGEDGGNGGNGGNGGVVRVNYITASGEISLSSRAGRAGKGGRGGRGGSGGEGGRGFPPDGKDGRPGRDGMPGFDGFDGSPGKSGFADHGKITEDEYWNRASDLDRDWANYRVRVGEYLFRLFIPNEENSNFLQSAMDEFNAALRLDPGNAQAMHFKNLILSNCNVLGLSRDKDVIPDFEYWEEVVKNYDEPILSMFNAAIDMINKGHDVEWAKRRLDVEIGSAQNLLEILKLEEQAAKLEVQSFTKEIEIVERRLTEIREQIEDCEGDTFSTGDLILGFGQAAALIFSIAGSGVGLVAAVPSLVALGEIFEGDLLKVLKSKEGKENLKELSGGLKELWDGSNKVIDLIKVINDIGTSDSRRPKCIRWLRQEVEILHKLLLAELHKQQANVLLLVANARVAKEAAYIEALEKQKDELTGDLTLIRQIVQTIRKSLKYYTDMYLRYLFYEARSLEIYTATDLPATLEVRYDCVYLHPDLEENFMDGFGDNVMLNFIMEHLKTWTLFIQTLEYRIWYDKYMQGRNWIKDIYRISFSESQYPDEIAKFREVNELQFTIDLEDLHSNRYEAKAESVELFLHGVTSNSAITPAISCFIEHSGLWKLKKLNGDIANMTLRPRLATVVVEEIEQKKYRGKTLGTKPKDLSFWGRGLVATWHLFIEQEEMDVHEVDLSELSGIEIWIGYKSALGWYFKEIVDAMEEAERFINKMTFEEFIRDKKTIYAVKTALENLLKAIEYIPDNIRRTYPEVPWSDIGGIRDVLIHDYFGVGLQTVWVTLKTEFPRTKSAIQRVLMDLDQLRELESKDAFKKRKSFLTEYA